MIYAINKRTKEHRVIPLDDRIGSWMPEWETVGADADGWIEWNGGECPLPDGVPHEVQIRDSRPQTWRWDNGDSDGDIIAYRPILDADAPAEPEAAEWDGEGLPTVGCECEVFEDQDWRYATIVAH